MPGPTQPGDLSKPGDSVSQASPSTAGLEVVRWRMGRIFKDLCACNGRLHGDATLLLKG